MSRATGRELVWMVALQLVSSVSLAAQVLLASELFVSLLAHRGHGPETRAFAIIGLLTGTLLIATVRNLVSSEISRSRRRR